MTMRQVSPRATRGDSLNRAPAHAVITGKSKHVAIDAALGVPGPDLMHSLLGQPGCPAPLPLVAVPGRDNLVVAHVAAATHRNVVGPRVIAVLGVNSRPVPGLRWAADALVRAGRAALSRYPVMPKSVSLLFFWRHAMSLTCANACTQYMCNQVMGV